MATEGFKRKLTAIFSADVVGYSRLMGEDEESTVKTLEDYKGVMFSLIKQHRGRVVDSPGDNLLAEFASVVDAVQCAVALQKELKSRNEELPEMRRMLFRIGINLGDVIEEQERLYGDGVNIAARLESLADPGGICISKTAFDHIESKLPFGYQFLGEQTVKNIAKPVGAYSVIMEPRITGREAHDGAGPELSEEPTVQLPDRPSIAVLPFQNMSNDPEQEYFSDGITEDIITDLSKLSGLFVIARNTAFVYKGKAVKVKDVGRELGVHYVLEGSVRKAMNRVRITAQLIDATTEGHLWAERYDRELDDIFALQDEVTEKIVSSLTVQLTEDEQQLRVGKPKYTNNMDAYDYYLRGLEHLYRFTEKTNMQAREMFEKSLAHDPKYALAHAMMAQTYLMEWTFGWSANPETLEDARKWSKATLDLDDSIPEAHCVLGQLHLSNKKHEHAIEEIEKAISLAPNNADFIVALGSILNLSGKPEQAISLLERAIRLNPVYPAHYIWSLGHGYFLTRQHKKALELFERALNLNQDWWPSHVYSAACYVELGQMEEAQAAATKVIEVEPTFSLEHWKKYVPYKNQEDVDRLISALRKTGLK